MKGRRHVPGMLLVACIAWHSACVQAGVQTLREAVYDFRQIAVLAKELERQVASRRARVAIISRVCLKPELLPPGVTFSHVGFAVYSRIETRDGRLVPGYAVYNLYQGEERTGRSYLAQDYPVDYLAVAQQLKTGVIIPNHRLQQALLRTIFSPAYARLHNPRYSVLSNPFNSMYQNCTEFVLDVLFAAIYGTDDPRKIKANIAAWYEPFPLVVDAAKLKFAAATMADVSVDDHTGPVAIATFETLARFMLKFRLADEAFILSVDPTTLYGTTEPFVFR